MLGTKPGSSTEAVSTLNLRAVFLGSKDLFFERSRGPHIDNAGCCVAEIDCGLVRNHCTHFLGANF